MDMASMTDIVFMLLLFFIMTSNLDSSSAILLNLPKTTASDKVISHIDVSLTKDLKYYVGNSTKEIDVANLSDEIEKLFHNGTENHILLRVDQGVTLQHIMEIYSLAEKLDCSISLAVKNP